ncbi:MAG TPA: hypothetical protein VLB29_05085 [Nocardioidaceae bacterium]|nr:hypothetical protein [Nocardioidaceae bacterium]
MTPARALLFLMGLVVAAVGAVELLDEGAENLLAVAVWLAGGVLLHDFVLAPLVIVLVVIGLAVLPGWARPAVAAATVVLGSVTLMAVPVLGRFGARPDNPTLLDRPYVAGWLVLAGLVWACAFGWAFARRQSGGE